MAKACTFVSWDESPHLNEDAKKSILAGIPPWQRDSRTKGIPQLGAGAIYTCPESDFVIQTVQLQPHWPRCFAQDVGWKLNAALFAAIDRDTNTVYIYDEIYKAKCEPAIMAAAIRARGDWIPGVIDPASRGRGQRDGSQLIKVYQELGLDIRPSINSVEAGLLRTWEMLSTGQIKVFSKCTNFLAEYRLYRRDMKGNIVKSNDHLMDCFRYMIMSGLDRSIIEPSRNSNGKQWWDWEPKTSFWIG